MAKKIWLMCQAKQTNGTTLMTKIQDTSREAYEMCNRGNDSWYGQVLSALEDNPSTCDELEIALHGRHQTISSRIRKGVKEGYIKSTGEKRPTRTGRNAIIWERIKGVVTMNGFETHGIGHLSPSQINMAMDSASAWVVSKLLKQRFTVGIPAERGKAVESGVARGLYHPDIPISDCQARAIEVFESNTALMSGLDSEERKKVYPTIEAMVEMAVEQLRPLGNPIWPAETHQNRVEIKCRFKKGEDGTVPIIGFLDFLYDTQIVDLKTTGRLPTKMSAAHCRQAAVYARATGLPIKFLYVSPKNYRWLEPEDIDQSLDEIKAQVKRLEKFLSVSNDPKFLASIVPHNPSSFYWNGNRHLEGELDRA